MIKGVRTFILRLNRNCKHSWIIQLEELVLRELVRVFGRFLYLWLAELTPPIFVPDA